jgi:hypothetical protein
MNWINIENCFPNEETWCLVLLKNDSLCLMYFIAGEFTPINSAAYMDEDDCYAIPAFWIEVDKVPRPTPKIFKRKKS